MDLDYVMFGKQTHGYIVTRTLDGYLDFIESNEELLDTIRRFCENNGKRYDKAQSTTYYMPERKVRLVQRTLAARRFLEAM